MKAMTCKELGGSCDFTLSAETCEGMIELMWNHMKEKHPVVLAELESTEPAEWRAAVRKEWEATPEVHARNR